MKGIQLNPQHQSVMDMSIKTISQYITLLDSILMEWEKISGVSRQRQGEIGAYEGKASSQQAILQSSHITEDLFRKFERMEQRDFQALLDYSKEAWLTGKKGMFVMPDGTTDFLDVNSMDHMETNYGIFVSDAGKDQEKLQNIKGLTQAMMQNGAKPGDMLLDYENIWDEGAIGTRCGYFIPIQKNLDGFIDNDGNSKAQEAIDYEETMREKKKGAADAKSLDQYIAEHPFSPQEATLQITANLFDIASLQEQYNNVKARNLQAVYDHL